MAGTTAFFKLHGENLPDDISVFAYQAIEALSELYEVAIEFATEASGGSKTDFAGQIIVAPPSAIADRWSRRFPDLVAAFASGWMRVRARARQRQVELPLILSDHADWNELTGTLAELRPAEVWITHGAEEALCRWSELNGLSVERARLFERAGDGRVRVPQTVASLVSFKPLNLMAAWPMKGPFDAIFCRNVAIYFDKPTQGEVFSRLGRILAPGGFLYIGHSENLGAGGAGFRLVGKTIYQSRVERAKDAA